eukprot:1160804-Pelagomonas_calceolata.AAC.23
MPQPTVQAPFWAQGAHRACRSVQMEILKGIKWSNATRKAELGHGPIMREDFSHERDNKEADTVLIGQGCSNVLHRTERVQGTRRKGAPTTLIQIEQVQRQGDTEAQQNEGFLKIEGSITIIMSVMDNQNLCNHNPDTRAID